MGTQLEAHQLAGLAEPLGISHIPGPTENSLALRTLMAVGVAEVASVAGLTNRCGKSTSA